MPIEIWKDIKNYEGLYQVSNLGRVRSLDRVIHNSGLIGKDKTFIKKGRILSPRTSKSRGLVTGYYRVYLTDGRKGYNKCIHKLVAETFIPNPENKPQVDHIDKDVTNNAVTNLRWCTQLENNRFKRRTNMGLFSDLIEIVDNTTSIATTPIKTITKSIKEIVDEACDDD